MSKRAAEMLGDDLEALGPVRISEVETAQKKFFLLPVDFLTQVKLCLAAVVVKSSCKGL